MKKLFITLTFFLLTLTACSPTNVSGGIVSPTEGATATTVDTTTATTTSSVSTNTTSSIEVDYDQEDLGSEVESDTITPINLNGNNTTFEGAGVVVDGQIVTINAAGAYELTGSLDNGQIIIDTGSDDQVELVLNGVEITTQQVAAIDVQNADKVIIILAANATNMISSKAAAVDDAETDNPNAAIYSRDDFSIKGTGSLTVNSDNNHGIASKDDLLITAGNITVNSGQDGIKGRDVIGIKDGTITINAGGDGMQSTNIDEADLGNIVIDGGIINITAGLDGIQAVSNLVVNDGEITITTGNGSGQNYGGSVSQKGLKATHDLTINAGTINIDSLDDSIHANQSIYINGGDILVSSGDDGIHADASIEINAGNLNILKSYEGIESAIITINDGMIHLEASDDGINGAGGADGSSMGGRPGQNNFMAGGNYYLYINGGYVYVNANGDGIDINGPVEMNGGVVLVNGPTENMNGPLDYTGSFAMNGGLLIAAGSAGMSQAPSTDSIQYSVLYNFSSTLAGGTMVHVESSTGEEILTFAPVKNFQSFVFSTADLQNGETYNISVGGSSSGGETDGLYPEGQYSGGTQVTSITLSSIVTSNGTLGGFPGGGGGRPGGGGHPKP